MSQDMDMSPKQEGFFAQRGAAMREVVFSGFLLLGCVVVFFLSIFAGEDWSAKVVCGVLFGFFIAYAGGQTYFLIQRMRTNTPLFALSPEGITDDTSPLGPIVFAWREYCEEEGVGAQIEFVK